ncbi:endonuclease III [Enterococcus malodoratus]|uniref:Endonuclease III n=1 Tax=Enterococcus malodoratus ATCC 43197 TaxID=1158601 RepID=R2RMA9_9ENTE|nr:endonuclease III [Enterococcus malodoratus]EOH81711.1 endonuclease III [Enterococcus malodoratus ATCC 43197]EOT68793.1 endonuclease III [Enterococcus malodoratus ATCC 43197]SET87447.1 DNA-(apurinic or apyrimidinic site) lyase /endonuclease III [Enterococcus malodoratus]SPW86514.1 endonuclease III [Enterococcus malodoratus]STC71850.1 endonuclease III [Enterococcus malodoratus]
MLNKEMTMEALNRMYQMFPDAVGELHSESPFQLLIAVILSAQATDVSVNKATPALFAVYPTPEAMAQAPMEDLIAKIKTIGLYRNKAKNIKACAQMLLENYGGSVPTTREELIKLPGVGRKTANVVLGDAFGVPAIAVDTHVERVTKRLRICKLSASVTEVEATLMRKIPKELWVKSHHTLIFFGRYHCTARAPKCDICPLLDMCQDGKDRLKAARK